MNKTKTAIIVIIVLTLAIFISGCGKKADDLSDLKPITLEEEFEAIGVKVSSVDTSGDTIEVMYEASEADDYDSQIIADWAVIFGVSSQFGYDKITIVNTLNDEPFAKLTTTRQNVESFAGGSINESVFWENVDIVHVE